MSLASHKRKPISSDGGRSGIRAWPQCTRFLVKYCFFIPIKSDSTAKWDGGQYYDPVPPRPVLAASADQRQGIESIPTGSVLTMDFASDSPVEP